MQNDRNVYIVSFILFAFLVICMSFAFNSSLAIADDYHHKSKKNYSHESKELSHEIHDNDGNEITGELSAWLFALANLPVLFGLLYRSINRFGSLTDKSKTTLKTLKKAQKKYLMPLHYIVNIIALLLAIIHFSLSNCRSSSLPEWGLALMACIVVVGIILKMNITPKGVRKTFYKIHTNPLTIGLVVTVLLIGHSIVD
jgi:hypothetical protein